MFLQMRHQFKEDEKAYKHKLQAYQDGQQRQAQLVQKMQNKVGAGILARSPEWENGMTSYMGSMRTGLWRFM